METIETGVEEEVEVEPEVQPKPKPEPKIEETDEQKLARLERQLKQQKKKMGVEDEPVKNQDIGQLAFLEVRGITNQDDIIWLEKESKETGKPIEKLLGFKYVQEYLKETADNRTTAVATDIESGRGGQFAKKDADYWYSRYMSGKSKFKEIPKEFQREMVSRRESSEGSGKKFYNS